MSLAAARNRPHAFVRPLSRHAERLLQAGLAILIASGSLLSPDIPRPLPSLAPVAAAAPPSRLIFAPAGPGAGPARFVAGAAVGTVFFAPDEIVLALPAPAAAGPMIDPLAPAIDIGLSGPGSITALHLRFEGANPAPEIASGSLAPGRINYFRGGMPSQWRRDLATFADIEYRQLYPGVSLRYEGREGALKGTYLLEAGVDPAQIRWRYTGAADLRVEAASGDLRIALPDGRTLTERAPLAWQEVGGKRHVVTARYQLAADGEISFALGTYDPRLPLTIDPWLEYGTRLEGIDQDEGRAIARDAEGNIFVAGYTFSADFTSAEEAARSGRAIFISKLASDGSLLRSIIIDGSLDDNGSVLAIGPDGDVYLAGTTSSPDFPLQLPLQQEKGQTADAFVLRLSNDLATLRYSTFLGGNGYDDAQGLAVDGEGAAYLSGTTSSDNFPTINSLREPTVEGACYGGLTDCTDIFVSKVSPDGQSLAYSTYLGGSDWDTSAYIAVDRQRRVYITGATVSADILVRNAIQLALKPGSCFAGAPVPCADLYLTRLTADGQIDYSTYLGGFSSESSEGGIAVDRDGRAYLIGSTFSPDFPTVQPTQPTHGSIPYNGSNTDAFVTVVSADGQRLEFSSYLGGDGADMGTSIAVDEAGRIYVTGATNAGKFPLIAPLQATSRNQCASLEYEPFSSSCFDGFVAKFAAGGTQLLYNTLLSGSQTEQPRAITVDPAGNVYLTGFTNSPDFLADGLISGPNDAFVLKLTEAQIFGNWYVATTGSDLNDCRTPALPCATISAAISRAAAGSTIHVAAGTYAENLTIDVSLSILGAGDGQTIIDGGGQGRVIVIGPGVNATIEGLTVQNGALHLDWAMRAGPPMAQGRTGHSATFLFEDILVAGGCPDTDCGSPLADAWLYNVNTNTWRQAAPMHTPRHDYSATRLNDGSVVVAGGYGIGGTLLTSVERYYPHNIYIPGDPPEGHWVELTPLPEGRAYHTAALLHSHEILVVGGIGAAGNDAPLASTAIYSPRDNTWRAAAPLPGGRWRHTMTLLDDGTVLVAGGVLGNSGPWTAESLRYDPTANAWTITGPMSTPRSSHAAALLQGDLVEQNGQVTVRDGKVLVVGSPGLKSAEIFDPATNSWSPAPDMATPRWLHSLTTMANGEVLVAGGFDEGLVATNETGIVPDAEIYSPRTGQWRSAGNLITPRFEQQALQSSYGQVLLIGGRGRSDYPSPSLAEVERYGYSSFDASRDQGAGIAIARGGALTLRASLVRDNWSDLGGGGIYNQGTLRLERSVVRENHTATYPGGAGISNDQGTVELIDSEVVQNHTTQVASGIVSSGPLSLLRSRVNNNVTSGTVGCCGAGSAIIASGPVTLTDSQVNGNISEGNWSQQHSGGIFYSGAVGQLRLIRSQVNNNSVIATSGSSALAGGIYLHPQGGAPSAALEDSEVSGNIVTALAGSAAGGGIFIGGGTAILTGTRVLSNTTRSLLGSGGGAGIHNDGRVEVYGGAISGNHAEGGSSGGIYTSGTTIISATLISDNRADYGGGGGIADSLDSQLTVIGSSIRGNSAHQGGGIAASGALTITNSLITNNQAIEGLPGTADGGGLWVGGTATLSNVTVSGNSSAGEGGGVYVKPGATLDAQGSTIAENTAFYAGGLGNGGTSTLRQVAIRSNRTVPDSLGRYAGSGGGIGNDGTLRILQSQISGNQALNGGGGIHTNNSVTIDQSTLDNNSSAGGGAINADLGTLTIQASTLSNNQARDFGGAIQSSGSAITIRSSTLSGNSADRGGAIFGVGPIAILFSTITGNSGRQDIGGISSNGRADATNVTIEGSILAGNSAPLAPELPDFCGPLVSQGHNLIGIVAATNTCAFAPAATDQVGTLAAPLDPSLGPLANNGGPTLTHALLPGSPALDAAGATCPAADQRGAARPQQGACDVGAFELENPQVFFGDLAGFNAAAGSPPVVITFENLPVGDDISGQTIAGVTLLPGEQPAPSAPLIVVRGADTFTPGGSPANRLTPTSGDQLLSPGGATLVLGPAPLIENDDLELRFDPPAAAVGFDILYQSLDCCSYVGVTVYGAGDRVLYRNPSIPTGGSGNGTPEGPVFFGVSSPAAPIYRVVVDEYDGNSGNPDANIGFDTVRVSLPPGDLYVAPAGSDANDCQSPDTPCRTIRSALARAAAGSTVNVAAGSYREVLSISRDVRVVGAGPEATIIDGGGRAGAVVGVSPGVAASLADLTITGGDATGNGGAGVYNQGDLTLERVAVSQNHSLGGAGGIGNYGTLALRNSQVISNTGTYGGLVNNGTLTVTASLIAQNTASGPGGGLANLAGATMYIESSSVISGNRAANGGGGIVNSGALRMLDSTVSNNETMANSGGGILSFGPLELSGATVSANRTPNGSGGGIVISNRASNSITASTISGNSAVAGGGIVASSGATLEIVNSTVSANTAYDGGGISTNANLTLRNTAVRDNQTIADPLLRYGGSGAGISNGGPLTIIRSQISGNRALNAGAGMYISGTGVVSITQSTLDDNSGHVGGAIYAASQATLTIEASTLSNNHSNYVGGAICHCGGVSSTGRLTITNSTFSGNSSGPIPGGASAIFSSSPTTIRSSTFVGNSTTGGPGAIVNQDITGVNSFTIEGSIVAGNSAPFAPDVCNFITSQGHNLIGIVAATNTCDFAPAAGDQVGTAAAPLDPMLGPLADNGGPTLTHDLLAGSPALDAGGTLCPPEDQRGAARPAGAACDIGAVESTNGFNPGLTLPDDVYSFENQVATFDPLSFFEDFGIAGTTHVITNSTVISSIEGLDSVGLPISFDDINIDAILPISITAGLTYTDTNGVVNHFIPRPTAWLFEEIVVKSVYESKDWGYEPAINGGLCVGMAATVGGFKGKLGPEFDPTLYGSVESRISSIDRAAIIELLAKYQGRQVGAQALDHQANQGHYTAVTLYAHLVERMRSGSWWADPELIGVYQGNGCEEVEVGHALLPYRLEPQSNSTARIYVYDSNYPPVAGSPERYITIDFKANTWSYLIGTNKKGEPVTWMGEDLFGMPIRLFTEAPQIPYLEGDSIIAVGGRMRGSWGGGYTVWGRMRGSWGDPDDPTITGCLPIAGKIQYLENITGSLRLRPLGGSLPPIYYFPANKTPLTLTGTGGEGQRSGDIVIFGPGGVMGFSSATSPGAEYSATVNEEFHTLTLSTTDTPRPMTAFQMQETKDGAGTRVFAVSNVLVGADGDISISVSADLSSVQVKNERDEPITFDLGLASYSGEAIDSTTRSYTIQPGGEYRYTPSNWADLTQPIDVLPIGPTRTITGLAALYDFTDGAGQLIASSGGMPDAPALRITRSSSVQWRAAGIKVTSPTRLEANQRIGTLIRQLDAARAFSLELWVDPGDEHRAWGTLLDIGGRVPIRLNQQITDTGSRLIAQFYQNGDIDPQGAGPTITTPYVARGPGPMQIVLTRDTSGLVRIYIDGELIAERKIREPAWQSGPQRPFLTLANTRTGTIAWLGTLRLFAIYERALGAKEVRQNYQAR